MSVPPEEVPAPPKEVQASPEAEDISLEEIAPPEKSSTFHKSRQSFSTLQQSSSSKKTECKRKNRRNCIPTISGTMAQIKKFTRKNSNISVKRQNKKRKLKKAEDKDDESGNDESGNDEDDDDKQSGDDDYNYKSDSSSNEIES